MSAAIRIVDETPEGRTVSEHRLELRLVSERVTARELVERRVLAEVKRHNASPGEYYGGLVQPREAEQVLNGFRLRERRQLDAVEQARLAIEAFDRGRFLLLVGDEQVEGLDTEVVLEDETVVRFIKLVPLVGG